MDTFEDERKRLELKAIAAMYFANPEFKQALSDYVWALNNTGVVPDKGKG